MKKRRNDKQYRNKFYKLAIKYNKKYPIENIEYIYMISLFRLLTDARLFKRVCNTKGQPINLKKSI